jgi:deoxycytidylate deaminase
MTYPKGIVWAAKVALRSTHRQRVGAVLVSHGRPLAVGHNSIRGHRYSRYYKYPEACHAEAATIAALDMYVPHNACVMYVARVNKQGQYMMSRPCDSCMRVIRESGIRKVVYTTGMGWAEETII